MGVERLARKGFGFVVALLLGIAIYFQAAGAVELVASKALAVAPRAPKADAKSRLARQRTSPQASTTNGDAILERNPFDSLTGPLDRNPISIEAPVTASKQLDLSDPLNAPECPE